MISRRNLAGCAFVVGPLVVACGSVATEPQPTEAQPTVAVERPRPAAEFNDKLIGWWLRHDQSYMMVLDAIGDDGRVEAQYLNPKPVHVSKAEVWIEDGLVRLLLELTDKNYPGNYYELAYLPDEDRWLGLYHHLGVDETYEVYFTRFDGAETAP